MPLHRWRLSVTAGLALLFTYLFFFEYLPPFRWVDITSDLAYFQYPLDDYAFQRLKDGRLPEWDPTMYSGMDFAGNPQAALFYPPLWLVFAQSWGRHRLPYRPLEILVFVHVWVAFLLAFVWLRGRSLNQFACLLGAGIYAFSGYMLLQLTHFGLVVGYCWLPLGLWSIDQASSSHNWRPLWKLSVASALCFLAGHPPTWFTFATLLLAYAVGSPYRSRVFVWTAGALTFSLLLVAVQLLPAWSASLLKEPHQDYGAGIRDWKFYLSYFIPNFFDYDIRTPALSNLGYEYLYLGWPALFGILWLALHPKAILRVQPVLALGLVTAVLVTNPYDLVWNTIRHSTLLAQICRSWYFLMGFTVAAAALATAGLDHFLAQVRSPAPRWSAALGVFCLVSWSIWLFWKGHLGGIGFSSGWKAAFEPSVGLALFGISIWTLSKSEGPQRTLLAIFLLSAVGMDYKAFGAVRRINAVQGNLDRLLASSPLPGMDPAVYGRMLGTPEYRVGLDTTAPMALELRHYRLTTPQGGDPLAPAAYLKLVPPQDAYYGFVGLDSGNYAFLRNFGLRYFVTSQDGSQYQRLIQDTCFTPIGRPDHYYKVFELCDPVAQYRWESPGVKDWIQRVHWTPEVHEFVVFSENGSRFQLAENFYPGWQATVDRAKAPIERWNTVFQAVAIPPGQHQIQFSYRSSGLRAGAAISLASVCLLAIFVFCQRPRPAGTTS